MMNKRGELLDVTVGTYNGSENYELVGLFIFYKFQQFNKINNFDLYRNDGLVVVKNMIGPQSEKVKKELQVLFNPY